MKRILFCLAILATALMAVSCAKEKENSSAGSAIDIQTSIEASTRVAMNEDGSGNFFSGDLLGLYAQVGQAAEVRVDNMAYTIGQTKLYWDNLSVRDDILFTAYYPRTASVADAKAYNFNVAQAEGDAKDLLLGKAEAVKFAWPLTDAQKVNLKFKHAMHKLVVKLVAGEQYSEENLKAATVEAFGYPVSVVDLLTSKVTGVAGEKAWAKSSATNTLSHIFLMAPSAITTGTGLVKITLFNAATNSNKEYLYTAPKTVKVDGKEVDLTELESGKCLTLTITVSKVGMDLNFDATEAQIGEWVNQGNLDGDAIASDSNN